ncbi:hypothetical protein WJX75_008418 [Coccomyxa subellipsoidea]|uniref:Uncharacterized protein n=1 Tax=Coccomyxa subellipsoidea TaxID=248742 RepID=A0ABR2YGV8_9CHLO
MVIKPDHDTKLIQILRKRYPDVPINQEALRKYSLITGAHLSWCSSIPVQVFVRLYLRIASWLMGTSGYLLRSIWMSFVSRSGLVAVASLTNLVPMALEGNGAKKSVGPKGSTGT